MSGDDVERFLERARAAVATSAGAEAREEIGRLLRELGRSAELPLDDVRPGLHASGAAMSILARDPDGLTLMLARFPADAPTPVHDHKSWGVACVIRGRDRHLHWRLDDGFAAERARVRVDDDREIGEGEFVHWGDPPDDIHSQQGVGGAVYELVCFGRDPTAAVRRYFDPEAGTVREEPPR